MWLVSIQNLHMRMHNRTPKLISKLPYFNNIVNVQSININWIQITKPCYHKTVFKSNKTYKTPRNKLEMTQVNRQCLFHSNSNSPCMAMFAHWNILQQSCSDMLIIESEEEWTYRAQLLHILRRFPQIVKGLLVILRIHPWEIEPCNCKMNDTHIITTTSISY